jgi:kynurenine formamidase
LVLEQHVDGRAHRVRSVIPNGLVSDSTRRTHFDAPVHWVTGKDHPNNCVDTIDVREFIGPACVVDASSEVAANADWVLSVEFLEAWELKHGRIAAGSWLLLRTDWNQRIRWALTE